MGIRSDVGIAIKKNVQLSEDTVAWLKEYCWEELSHKDGTLYVLNGVKWYDLDPRVVNLNNELDNYNSRDYKIIEACSEFPNSGVDSGDWDDNPWDLYKEVSVSLGYVS